MSTPAASPAAARTTRVRRSREESRALILEALRELVRERSYAELSVGEIMDRAGIGRTLFYRYFDDLGDLLRRAGREPIIELFAAQEALGEAHDDPAGGLRDAHELGVAVYRRHGPVLRAIAEGASVDRLIAEGQERFRAQFDELVAKTLRRLPDAGERYANVDQTARALNLLSTSYLLDAFGREPRVSDEVAVQTLTELWLAAMGRVET